MATNAVSQNSTNQPGNVVTPNVQNPSGTAPTQAVVTQLPGGVTQINAPSDEASQVAARAQIASELARLQTPQPTAPAPAPVVQAPAPQAPGTIQNVSSLGQTPAPAPQPTVGVASYNPGEVRPTTSAGVQSNTPPTQTDYATNISAQEQSRSPNGTAVTPEDRISAVTNLAKQGFTDVAQLQNYLNNTQAGGLPTGYTTQEIQQILAQNPSTKPTAATSATDGIQSGITQLQNILNGTQKTIVDPALMTNLTNALTQANSGVVTSDLATNIKNTINGIISNFQTLSLPQLPDFTGEISALKSRTTELSNLMDNPNTDPAMQQFLALEQQNASDRISQIQDIQERSQAEYDKQTETNKQADARAIVAMAGARLTGSPVAADYLTSVALAGRRALTEITTAQNHAITEAESAFRKDDIDLALKKIDLAETRRSQYFDLLGKQVDIEQKVYQAKTDQVRLQSDLQDKYEARKQKEQDFVTTQMKDYADKGIDASVIPDSFFNDYATKFGTTSDFARTLYQGSLQDQKSKDAETFNKNTEAFYKAAQSLPANSDQVLYRPNLDGTFTSIARSKIQTNPDYDTFNVTKNGKQYAVYVDKTDPTNKKEVELGNVDPKTTFKEDAIGNTIAITDNGDGTFTSKTVIDYMGNPNGSTAVTNTLSQLNSTGNTFTQSSGTPTWTQTYPDGSVHQRGNTPAPECGQFVNDVLKTSFPDSLGGKIAQCDPTIGTKTNPVKVGDAIVTAEAAGTGHVAIINSIGSDEKGQYYTLTESNYKKNDKGQGIVTNTRKIYANNALIKGYGRGSENPATKPMTGPQLPADNKMSWTVDAPVGSPVMTAAKNGTVQDVVQVGQYKDGSPMYMVSIKDNDTGTITNYSGLKNSEVRIGSSWSSSEVPPSMGTTGTGGHTVDVRNGDGSPMAPTGEVDTQKYGTWGDLPSIPPKIRPNIETIRNDIEAGKIDLDTAVKRVKSDPLLSRVSSSVVLDDLGASYKYAQAQQKEKDDAKAAASDLKNQNKDYTQQDNLRKEVQGLQEVKELKTTRDSFSIINALASKRGTDGTLSGAGDMSMIFAYMKMLDPNSTVREGEFANAENAGGISSTVQNTYNKIIKGNRLTKDQVDRFQQEAKTLYDSKASQVQPTIDFYSNLAKQRGFDPSEVIPDVTLKTNAADSIKTGSTWTDPKTGETFTVND